MSNPERVENDQNHCPPRRGHFLAAHIMLYLITIVRFVIALYMYYARSDDISIMNFWIMLTLPPTLLLFSRDIFVLFRKRTLHFSLWVEIVIMLVFLSGSGFELYLYSPVWIFEPEGGDPSFYTIALVSIFSDLLSIAVAIFVIFLCVSSLRFHWKESARRRAGSNSDAPPSSRFFGEKRTSIERGEFPGEIKEFALKYTVFRKKKFEPTSLAIIRGLLATAILTLLVIYGLDVAIRQPVAERAKGPSTRSGQLLDTPDSSFHLGFLDNMAFIVGSPKSFGTNPLSMLDDTPDYFAPNVTTIQTMSINGTETTCYPSSRIPSYIPHTDSTDPVLGSLTSYINETEVAFINCSRNQVGQPRPSLPYTLHIQIGVDYSQWNKTTPFPDYLASFNVYMMAADQIVDGDYFGNYVFPSMTPFPLLRNAHLRGTVNVVMRKVIVPTWTDLLGLQPNYTEFLLFSLDNLFPDPSSTFSPNTSSVVFTGLLDTSYIVVLEDYRQHTFFSGLASVGGIFTVLDGIFAMIFGMGLMSILFGSKTISPFGIVGLFIRERLQKEIHEKYPMMQDDLRQRGMASFLRDVEIEVGLLDEKSDEQVSLRRRNTNRECDASESLLTNLEDKAESETPR